MTGQATRTNEGTGTKEVALPIAKAGTLTTRTEDDTGEATLGAGHGITTGAIVDIYWSGGRRYGVTVGTVAGNVVPFGAPGGTGACRNWRSRGSTIEIDRGGTSYSVDTLRAMRARMPDASLHFIVGFDAFREIHTWRDSERLFDITNIVVISRPPDVIDTSIDHLPVAAQKAFCYHPATQSYRHSSGTILRFLAITAIDVSASMIRQRRVSILVSVDIGRTPLSVGVPPLENETNKNGRDLGRSHDTGSGRERQPLVLEVTRVRNI